MFSSVIAEAVSMVIYYPYEIFKVRYIAKNEKFQYKGITHAFSNIVEKEGIRGLYNGSSFFLVNAVMS